MTNQIESEVPNSKHNRSKTHLTHINSLAVVFLYKYIIVYTFKSIKYNRCFQNAASLPEAILFTILFASFTHIKIAPIDRSV